MTTAAAPAPVVRGDGAVRAAVGAVTVTTVSVLPVFLTGALAVQISAELGFDPAGLGLVVALYFGVSALCSLPVGRLVERWGGTVTSRLAVLGVAVVMLLLAWQAGSYASLVVILLCSAWCNVMGQLASNLTLARSVPAQRLGLSFGVKQAAIPLSTLLAGAAVPAVALTVGWRWAYVLAAGLALLALLGIPRGGEPHVRTARPAPGERATLALAVLGCGSGLGAAAANALGIFLVAAAVERGIAPGTAGLVLTGGSVVGLVARLLHGWLADRRSGGHVAFVAGSMALGAIGLGLLALPGTVALVVGVVLGFGLGWSWPGLMQFAVVRLNPSAPAAASSIVQTGVYAGGLGGPIAFGFVAAHSSFTAAWTMAAAAMVAAALLVVLGRRLLLAHAQSRSLASTSSPSTSSRSAAAADVAHTTFGSSSSSNRNTRCSSAPSNARKTVPGSRPS
jgi:MFS family permease